MLNTNLINKKFFAVFLFFFFILFIQSVFAGGKDSPSQDLLSKNFIPFEINIKNDSEDYKINDNLFSSYSFFFDSSFSQAPSNENSPLIGSDLALYALNDSSKEATDQSATDLAFSSEDSLIANDHCDALHQSILDQIQQRQQHTQACITQQTSCTQAYRRFQDCNYTIGCNSQDGPQQDYMNSCQVFSNAGWRVEQVHQINCETFQQGDGRDVCIHYLDYKDQCQNSQSIDFSGALAEVCESM